MSSRGQRVTLVVESLCRSGGLVPSNDCKEHVQEWERGREREREEGRERGTGWVWESAWVKRETVPFSGGAETNWLSGSDLCRSSKRVTCPHTRCWSFDRSGGTHARGGHGVEGERPVRRRGTNMETWGHRTRSHSETLLLVPPLLLG